MFLCKFTHPGILSYFGICSRRHVKTFVCVCLHSWRLASPPTAWQLCCAKFQATPHSSHMAPHSSPTSTIGDFKRKTVFLFSEIELGTCSHVGMFKLDMLLLFYWMPVPIGWCRIRPLTFHQCGSAE